MSLAKNRAGVHISIAQIAHLAGEWTRLAVADPSRLGIYFWRSSTSQNNGIFPGIYGQPTDFLIDEFTNPKLYYTYPVDGPLVGLEWWTSSGGTGLIGVVEMLAKYDGAAVPCKPSRDPYAPPGRYSSPSVVWTDNLTVTPSGKKPGIVTPSEFPGVDIAEWIQSLAAVNAALQGADGNED